MGDVADEAFKRALERIAQAERSGSDDLDLSDWACRSLEKLPNEIIRLKGMTRLDLRRSRVSDLSVLSGLTGLTSLNLMGSQVRDLSALSGLTGLTWLDLARTEVGDVAELSSLTALATLDLSGTRVRDVSALSGLMELAWLSLWNTEVSDVSALSSMTKLTSLNLTDTMIRDVSALSELKELKELDITGTQVSNISALSGLKKLVRLGLVDTKVADLSALSGMRTLEFLNVGATAVDKLQLSAGLQGKYRLVPPVSRKGLRGPFGVQFADCAAAQSDRKLEKISKIGDDRDRTLQLFAYLGVEVEEDAPTPDPLLPSLIDGGKLEIPASFPGTNEQEERLKRALHDRLRPKTAEAAQKAGNEFPRMGGKARVLAALLDRPFEEVDLLAVHLEVEDIEARAKAGGEDGIPYDTDLLAAVGEVTRLGPGLTRGNADVELFFARLIQTRDAPVLAEVEAKRAELSDAILADPAAHGPRSLAMEARLKDAIDPDVARTLRGPKQYNLLWRLGSVAALAVTKEGKTLASGVAGSLIATAYGTEITAFVSANWALLKDVAATYGAGFSVWISGTVGLLMIGKGAKIERDRRRGRGKDDGTL